MLRDVSLTGGKCLLSLTFETIQTQEISCRKKLSVWILAEDTVTAKVKLTSETLCEVWHLTQVVLSSSGPRVSS